MIFFWKKLKNFEIFENPYWKIDFLKKIFDFQKSNFLKIQEGFFENFDKTFFKIIFLQEKKIFFLQFFFSELEFFSSLDSRHSCSQSTAHGLPTQRFIQKCTVMNFLLETLSYESSSNKKFVTVKFFIKVVLARALMTPRLYKWRESTEETNSRSLKKNHQKIFFHLGEKWFWKF